MKDTYLVDNYSINCKGNLIDLSSPKVMSIINTTPDSFHDGGKHSNMDDLLRKVELDLSLGATFIDVGGYSSRPNANKVEEEEEISRTTSTIEEILKRFPNTIISIDTFRGKVASLALDAGASMINDISAWEMDNKMLETIKKYKVPYVLMHMKGIPENMQDNPVYNNLTKDVISFLTKKITILKKAGIKDIIVDPGIGFGKTLSHNYELIGNLNIFKTLNLPILLGLSRKSLISKLLNSSLLESINGTTALNMYSLNEGVKILRVHDVKEAMECVKIYQEILNNK